MAETKTSKSRKKHPAPKKSGAKASDAKKKPPKSAVGKKKNSAQTTPKKSAASRKPPSGKSVTNNVSRKSRKTSSKGASRWLASFYKIILFSIIFIGLSIGGLVWFHGEETGPARHQEAAERAEIPPKTQQFHKTGNKALAPSPKNMAPISSEASSAQGLAQPLEKDAPLSDPRPMAAIIIDDMGECLHTANKFFDLNARLTYSILPYAKHRREIADAAFRRGYQVMLHLPMEPNGYPDVDPGPGALLTRMTPDERIGQLKNILDAVPHVRGVNNHMGSKMTAMADQMNQVFTVLKQRELFFIDSRTTAATQCRSSARLFKLPFAERDVFLDHVQTRPAIAAKIEEFINTAEINGTAIAIAHPYELTYEMLLERLPEIKRRLRLAPASAMVAHGVTNQ